jgi:hypothetical protein
MESSPAIVGKPSASPPERGDIHETTPTTTDQPTHGRLPFDAYLRQSTPLDLRAWTEWGVSPRHFAEVNDSVFGAPFILGDTWGRDE